MTKRVISMWAFASYHEFLDAVKESETLTRAAAMVFLDLDWLPGKQIQLEGRIYPDVVQ